MTEIRPRKLTVLLVEDSAATLKLQSLSLEAAGRFRALNARNGKEALDILRRHRVDVVVTDLHMPLVDGFQLIAELSVRYPGLPIFVLSGIPDLAEVDPALTEGCLHVHAKPPDYGLLAKQIYAVRDQPQSQARGIPIPGLLQLLQWEGRTATLTIHSGAKVGRLYLQGGKLIQAEAGEARGPEAAYAICRWSAPSVEFVDACRVEPAFSLSAEEIQMELALRHDQDHA